MATRRCGWAATVAIDGARARQRLVRRREQRGWRRKRRGHRRGSSRGRLPCDQRRHHRRRRRLQRPRSEPVPGAPGAVHAGLRRRRRWRLCPMGLISCLPNGTESACSSMCDSCKPGSLGCQGQQPVTCNTSGTMWMSVGPACSKQACVNGGCQGTCMPGATQCSGGLLQTCDPTGNWLAGVTCAAGEACDQNPPAACAAGCYIGSEFVAPNAPNSVDACQICQPGTSTSAWADVADGTPCSAGACQAGGCVDDCYVGSTFYMQGQANPSETRASSAGRRRAPRRGRTRRTGTRARGAIARG
jgi:hypothetical protein